MFKQYFIVRYNPQGIDEYYHLSEDIFLPEQPGIGFHMRELAEYKLESLDKLPDHTYTVERLQ